MILTQHCALNILLYPAGKIKQY